MNGFSVKSIWQSNKQEVENKPYIRDKGKNKKSGKKGDGMKAKGRHLNGEGWLSTREQSLFMETTIKVFYDCHEATTSTFTLIRHIYLRKLNYHQLNCINHSMRVSCQPNVQYL